MKYVSASLFLLFLFAVRAEGGMSRMPSNTNRGPICQCFCLSDDGLTRQPASGTNTSNPSCPSMMVKNVAQCSYNGQMPNGFPCYIHGSGGKEIRGSCGCEISKGTN